MRLVRKTDRDRTLRRRDTGHVYPGVLESIFELLHPNLDLLESQLCAFFTSEAAEAG